MIEVCHASPVLHVAYFRNVAIVHTRGLLRVSDMRAIGDGYRSLIQRHPKGITSFSMLCAGTPVAEREAVAESARFMAELQSHMLSAAVVIEEQGIMAQVLTTVIRSINTITGHRTLNVFANQADALRAIAPHVQRRNPAEEITAMLLHAVQSARVDSAKAAEP